VQFAFSITHFFDDPISGRREESKREESKRTENKGRESSIAAVAATEPTPDKPTTAPFDQDKSIANPWSFQYLCNPAAAQ
jgi:hypothetical protein